MRWKISANEKDAMVDYRWKEYIVVINNDYAIGNYIKSATSNNTLLY